MGFAVGLPFFSTYLFALRAFYSLGNTKTPFFLGCLQNGANIVLALALFGSLGIPGLALAYSGSYAVAATITLLMLSREVGSLRGQRDRPSGDPRAGGERRGGWRRVVPRRTRSGGKLPGAPSWRASSGSPPRSRSPSVASCCCACGSSPMSSGCSRGASAGGVDPVPGRGWAGVARARGVRGRRAGKMSGWGFESSPTAPVTCPRSWSTRSASRSFRSRSASETRSSSTASS